MTRNKSPVKEPDENTDTHSGDRCHKCGGSLQWFYGEEHHFAYNYDDVLDDMSGAKCDQCGRIFYDNNTLGRAFTKFGEKAVKELLKESE